MCTNYQIDENSLTRKSCVLACRRFSGKHTFDKIAELLYDILCGFGIKREQLVSTVIDNRFNFVKTFKEFGCDMIQLGIYDISKLDGNIIYKYNTKY